MFALKHRTTGDVQFVIDKDVHDLSEWEATKLSRKPTEFDHFVDGKLIVDKDAKDKATKASSRGAMSATEREDELIAQIAELRALVDELIATSRNPPA